MRPLRWSRRLDASLLKHLVGVNRISFCACSGLLSGAGAANQLWLLLGVIVRLMLKQVGVNCAMHCAYPALQSAA